MGNGTEALVQLGLATALGLVALGAYRGWTGRIVVFENFNDLFFSFAGAILMVISILLGIEGAPPIFFVVVIISLGLTYASFAASLRSNATTVDALHSLITKIPLGILFIFALVEFVTPSGKTFSARSSSRALGFMTLLLVAPLIYKLVRTHEGVINPKAMLSRRGFE